MKSMKVILCCIFICLFQFSFGQEQNKTIAGINNQLETGKKMVNEILSDASLMQLHSVTAFRDVIKKNAKSGSLKIVTNDEPGKKIKVKATLTDKNRTPIQDALVYVYQTSDKGWYSDTAAHILTNSGDYRHARLFGYTKTNAKGEIEIETIQPRGYPDSDLPAHIHIAIWQTNNPVHDLPDELLFDDDPRLTPARRQAALQQGFLISKNTGTELKPLYVYEMKARN
jgi:protocatechuate 3,4-dioxygenase beta subunit